MFYPFYKADYKHIFSKIKYYYHIYVIDCFYQYAKLNSLEEISDIENMCF